MPVAGRPGLSPRLEHVVASSEVGVAKPDARIFAHACELFGVPASDATYVDDRLGTDAIGSAESGLTGVWLCLGCRPSSAESAAATAVGVRVIGILAELPGRWQAEAAAVSPHLAAPRAGRPRPLRCATHANPPTTALTGLLLASGAVPPEL